MSRASLVLIADDDDAMRSLLRTSFRRRGFEVAECRDGRELKSRLQSEAQGLPTPSLIVSDLRMPGVSGLDVLHWLGRARLDIPFILITAFGDPQTHKRAKALGAAAVVDKPFELEDFHAKVAEVLRS